MTGAPRRLGLTGASGYIGRAVISLASLHGWEVISIGRRQAPGTREHRNADLGRPPHRDLLRGLDAVMHLAATGDGGSSSGIEAECEFAYLLASLSAESGLPFLFTSSQAAAKDAPSQYGRTKALIEALVLPQGAIVVRPGLVYGGVPAGLFGVLVKLVSRIRLLPDLRPRPWVQPIHIKDLAHALFVVLDKPTTGGRILAIAGQAISFRDFVSLLAYRRQRARCFWIPVPVPLLHFLLTIAKGAFDQRLSPERLDSLMQLQPLESSADMKTIGVQLRDIRDGLSRSGRGRRRLLEECHAMTGALLGRRRRLFGLSKRYVRLIEARFDGKPLEPSPLRAWLLTSLDTLSARRGGEGDKVAERLTMISRLAESEAALVNAYMLLPGQDGLGRLLVGLTKAGLVELIARVSNPFARRWLRGSIDG